MALEDTRFLKRVEGQSLDDLPDDDVTRFLDLWTEGRAHNDNGIVRRVIVSYGDGKKSSYGATYADELTGEFS